MNADYREISTNSHSVWVIVADGFIIINRQSPPNNTHANFTCNIYYTFYLLFFLMGNLDSVAIRICIYLLAFILDVFEVGFIFHFNVQCRCGNRLCNGMYSIWCDFAVGNLMDSKNSIGCDSFVISANFRVDFFYSHRLRTLWNNLEFFALVTVCSRKYPRH